MNRRSLLRVLAAIPVVGKLFAAEESPLASVPVLSFDPTIWARDFASAMLLARRKRESDIARQVEFQRSNGRYPSPSSYPPDLFEDEAALTFWFANAINAGYRKAWNLYGPGYNTAKTVLVPIEGIYGSLDDLKFSNQKITRK